MDKTLRNGLIMSEMDPLNHKFRDLVGTDFQYIKFIKKWPGWNQNSNPCFFYINPNNTQEVALIHYDFQDKHNACYLLQNNGLFILPQLNQNKFTQLPFPN